MSAELNRRELIAFDGVVECRQESGAVALSLRGFERRTGRQGMRDDERAAEALFAAALAPPPAAAVTLPPRLTDVRVIELDGGADADRFQIRARELQLDLRARSVQIHRDAGRAFFSAVPPARVPLGRRIGWTWLLLLLRLPGAAGLLARLRGNR
ncbi:MAG: hypothetical protein ACHP9W_01570 [Steroidobacterales bacterium]